jgi:hypothetical protein
VHARACAASGQRKREAYPEARANASRVLARPRASARPEEI